MACLASGSIRSFSRQVTRLRPSDEPVIAGSNALLVRDTGWSPKVPIERTIADMLEFWRSRGV